MNAYVTIMMRSTSRRVCHIGAMAIAAATMVYSQPTLAQYDKDGRYVPSPNGIPADPRASVVPLYPGSPGGAIGTPTLPRAMTPQVPSVAPLASPPTVDVTRDASRRVVVTRKMCAEGWSRATGVARSVFERRCAAMPNL